MNKNRATVSYYIVRIYRKDAAALTGLVETPGGAHRAFHNVEELWHILQQDREDGDAFISTK